MTRRIVRVLSWFSLLAAIIALFSFSFYLGPIAAFFGLIITGSTLAGIQVGITLGVCFAGVISAGFFLASLIDILIYSSSSTVKDPSEASKKLNDEFNENELATKYEKTIEEIENRIEGVEGIKALNEDTQAELNQLCQNAKTMLIECAEEAKDGGYNCPTTLSLMREPTFLMTKSVIMNQLQMLVVPGTEGYGRLSTIGGFNRLCKIVGEICVDVRFAGGAREDGRFISGWGGKTVLPGHLKEKMDELKNVLMEETELCQAVLPMLNGNRAEKSVAEGGLGTDPFTRETIISRIPDVVLQKNISDFAAKVEVFAHDWFESVNVILQPKNADAASDGEVLGKEKNKKDAYEVRDFAAKKQKPSRGCLGCFGSFFHRSRKQQGDVSSDDKVTVSVSDEKGRESCVLSVPDLFSAVK